MKQEMMTIVTQRLLAPQIYEMTLTGELVKQMIVPGQFLHLKVPRADLLLRRPISINKIDHEKNECAIIYRVEGDGTDVLSLLQSGDKVDVMGPLGNGFPIEEVKKGEKILIIGGGIGIPPLYELSRQLVAKGAEIINIQGFRNRETIFFEEEFRELGEMHIATSDGSYGTEGYVCKILDTRLKEFNPDAVYACGANGMLKVVNERFIDHPRAYLSLEARMACGMGACYACVCPKANSETETMRVCKEGPIVATGEVAL